MELVKGIPITKFCDEQKLSIRERLELFTPVCQAIQHAHQKGIIHRDIKPSNVLVALYDGKPVPKVIDFGLAKAMGQQLTERTLFAGLWAVLGTLEYMSPEQAEVNQLDIDTRTDIYSLGVLLYELLTGTTPLKRESLQQGALDAVLRRIREEEPPRPSTRLSESKEALPSISAQRKLEPAQLRRLLRGDLDWIVMKALEKDRARRYDTANGLAMDVQRYLHGEPVVAGPPTARYRLQKFVRKHRAVMAAAAGFVLLLAAATVVSTVLALRANREQQRAETAKKSEAVQRQQSDEARRQAEAVSSFLVEAFRRPDPTKDGREVKVVELLDQAAQKLRQEFAGTSRSKGDLLDALGQTYDGSGLYSNAVELLEAALKVRQAELGSAHRATLSTMNNLAVAYRHAKRLSDALALSEQTLDRQKAILGPNDPDTLNTMRHLAHMYRGAGRLTNAITLMEETRQRCQAALLPDHPYTLFAISSLGQFLLDAGRPADALPLLEEAVRRQRTTLVDGHPDTIGSMALLADAYRKLGRETEAMAMNTAALAGTLKRAGPRHPHTRKVMSEAAEAADAHLKAGRPDLAETLLRELLILKRQTSEAGSFAVAAALCELSESLVRQDKYAAAEPLLREVLPYFEKQQPGLTPTFDAQSLLGWTLLKQQKLDEAKPLLLQAYDGLKRRQAERPSQSRAQSIKETAGRLVDLYEETRRLRKAKPDPDDPDPISSTLSLADAYLVAGRTPEALAQFKEALGACKTNLGPDHADTLRVMKDLASAYQVSGRPGDALPLLDERLKLIKARHGVVYGDTLRSMEDLADAYQEAGRPADAVRILEELLELREKQRGPEDEVTVSALKELALAYQMAGRPSEAVRLLEDLLRLREGKKGFDHTDVFGVLRSLGPAYQAAGRTNDALALFEKRLELRKARLGSDHRDTWLAMNHLAGAYLDAQRFADAEKVLHESSDRQVKASADRLLLAESLSGLGDSLLGQSKYAHAEASLRQSMSIWETQAPEDWRAYRALSLLGAVLMGQKRHAEAEPLLLRATDGLEQRAPNVPSPWRTEFLRQSREWTLQLYQATGQAAKTDEWRDRLALSPRAPGQGQLERTAIETGTEQSLSPANRIPPRDPQTKSNLIDLTAFYTHLFGTRWGFDGNDWTELSTGPVTLAGTEFDVRGLVHPGSTSGQANGIRVKLRADRLQILHGTHMKVADGTRIGSYVVHYSDGQQQEIPVVYGEDVREWWNYRSEEPQATRNAVLAWSGYNGATRSRGISIRFFVKTWKNPRPNVEIASLDIVSAGTRCRPFLIALTVE